jgi:hypothetical protein
MEVTGKSIINLLYIYLTNIQSSRVHRKFIEIPTLIEEKKKEKLFTTVIMKKIRLKHPST